MEIKNVQKYTDGIKRVRQDYPDMQFGIHSAQVFAYDDEGIAAVYEVHQKEYLFNRDARGTHIINYTVRGVVHNRTEAEAKEIAHHAADNSVSVASQLLVDVEVARASVT